jgi:hypothetical protein
MNPEIRIKTILLIDRIRKHKEYAGKLAVEDSSHYIEEDEVNPI